MDNHLKKVVILITSASLVWSSTVCSARTIGYSSRLGKHSDLFEDQVLESFTKQHARLPECARQKFNSHDGMGDFPDSCKPIRFIHPKGKPLSYGTKKILEDYFQLNVPIQLELYDASEPLYLPAADKVLETSDEAISWLQDHSSDASSPLDPAHKLVWVIQDRNEEFDPLTDSENKIREAFGIYDGVSVKKHFAKRLTKQIDSSNSAGLYHEYKNGWADQLAQLLDEEKDYSYKARFKPNLYNTLNALGIASIGTFLSFKASTQGGWSHMRGPVLKSHAFLFTWGVVLLELQREFGSFKMQGADWFIKYDEAGENARLVRRSNRPFFYATSFIQESLMLATIFYGFKLKPQIPVSKTIALALISAFSFVPIEKVRNKILLQAERFRLEGNEAKFNEMTKKGNLIGFIYWNFVFNVFKNLAVFQAPLPAEKILLQTRIFTKAGELKATGGSVHFWDFPLLALGALALAVDVEEHIRNTRYRFKSTETYTGKKTFEGQPSYLILDF